MFLHIYHRLSFTSTIIFITLFIRNYFNYHRKGKTAFKRAV